MPKDYIPSAISLMPPSRSEQLKEQTEDVKKHFKKIDLHPIYRMTHTCLDLEKEIRETEDFDQRMQLRKLLVDLYKDLAGYVAPKLKAVDVTGGVDTGVTVVLGLENAPSIRLQNQQKIEDVIHHIVEEENSE
jgi:hypothetical protein